jgi:hypothetical protein
MIRLLDPAGEPQIVARQQLGHDRPTHAPGAAQDTDPHAAAPLRSSPACAPAPACQPPALPARTFPLDHDRLAQSMA